MRWLVVLAALLIAPSAAHASTIRLLTEFEPAYKGPGGTTTAAVYVTAGPGEANDVDVRVDAGVVIVSDAAGAVPGPGCAPGDGGDVRCQVPPGASALRAELDTGDGADAVSVGPGVSVAARLGPGDDRVAVTDGSAVLDGGPGDDLLVGGSGNDALDGGPGADVMTGGAGFDLVTYAFRTAPVYATVGGSGGEAGEGDTIGADVEQILGGAGPDVLRGGPGNDLLWGGDGGDDIDGGPGADNLNGQQGPNRVVGGPGNDFVVADGTSTLLGGPGDDYLKSGPGNDLVDPGPGRDETASRGGADRLHVRDGEHDEVRCGPGASALADAHDLVLGCNRIDRDGAGHATLHLHRYITRPHHTYAMELLCSNDLRPRCAGRVRLTARGRGAGSARFAVSAGHARSIVVALAAFARRELADRGRLALAVRVDTRDQAGRPVVLRAREVERSRL